MDWLKTTTVATLIKRLESFPWKKWDASLAKGLQQPYRDLVIASGIPAADLAGGVFDPKDPLLSKFMTTYVMERAKQIDDTTRAVLSDLIRSTLAGESGDNLADKVRDAMREQFEGYEQWRANRIARTETAIAHNHGNTLGFKQAGVKEVEVLDGTDDDICAEANGEIWSIRDTLTKPLGHPNCTRSFSPVLPDEEESREGFALDDDLAFECAMAAEMIVCREDPHNRVSDAIEDEDES